MKVGIVGCGYWGANLARNFHQSGSTVLSKVTDLEAYRAEQLLTLYPEAEASTFSEMLANPDLDAVVIATPASTHYHLARKALLANKHVLVEKPASGSAGEMQELHEIAAKRGLVLMIDHTYLYSRPIKRIKQAISEGALGHITYIDSVRINLGKVQPDINVVWDLATHDISILNHLLETTPDSVQVDAASHLPSRLAHLAHITLYYPQNILAHIHCSWTSPVKRREMLIGGTKKMLVYNDLSETEKVVLHHCGYVFNDSEIGYYNEAPKPLKCDGIEPLSQVVNTFAQAVSNPQKAPSKAAFDVGVIQVLEAAQKSMETDGSRVFL